MKIKFLFLFLLCGAAVCINAQPLVPQNNSPSAEEIKRTIRKKQDLDQRFDSQKSIGDHNHNIKSWTRATAMQSISRIYRKPTVKESKLLVVEKEDLKSFASFLQKPDTGLTKLIIDRGCAESPNVFNISQDCLKYSMPGAGSSFSFREKNYRLRRLSDLTYDGEDFYSSGILSHAIMTDIGDVPFENIPVQTNALKFLTDFQVAADFEQARSIDKTITDGIENENLFYSRSTKVKENSTYVLRVVAYRGNVYRAFEGVVYDELDFDDRRDLTVAFRVVRRNTESITILWKIISNQKAPALKNRLLSN
jgi:hypothetical protein